MEYLTRVLGSRPLTIHFCLYNPAQTNRPVYIPRVLGPPGVFVTVEISDAAGKVVYEGPTVRATHRLDPADPASYRELEAGYTAGVVLEVNDFEARAGRYEVRLKYSNRPFMGTPTTPVGTLTHEATLALDI